MHHAPRVGNAGALGPCSEWARTLSPSYDLIVIGAGPAGGAAAVAAAECGLSVLVLDESRTGGGRIHRAPDTWLHESPPSSTLQEGEILRSALASSGAELAFKHLVWHVGTLPADGNDPQRFLVSMLAGEVQRQARSRALIVATGALERFYPRPGWTLPGVVSLGAATLMLKASGVLPGKRVAVVGPGALPVALTKLMVDAGGEVVALCDPNALRAWSGTLPAFARHAAELARGGAWLAALARARVPIYRGWDVRAIHGERAVESVTLGRVDDRWRPLPGADEKTIAVDSVCIGYGLASAIDIYRLLAATLHYVPALGGWTPVLDRGQRSDVPGLYGAGDGAGVLGAAAASATGRIAALSAALDFGRIDAATSERRTAAARRDLARAIRFGAALSRLVEARSSAVEWVPDETIVCRCEDIRAGELRAAIASGAQEINALKAATRCGMGPCGGRVCGETAAALLECAGLSRERIGTLTARAPLRPLPLSRLTGSFTYSDIPFPQAADP